MKAMVYRYMSICEPDVIRTLKELEIEVLEYTKEVTVKDYAPKDAVREIGEFLENNPVDFVFSINFFPYLAEVCNIFHIRYISWVVDSPVMELYTTAITKEYNRVFLFDRALFNEISPYNPGKIFHFPLAANVEEKEKLFKETSESDKKRFSHDIAFVGSLYTEKCPYDRVKNLPDSIRGYLDGIMAAQEKVYGYYFIEDLLKDDVVEAFKAHMEGFYTQPPGSFLTDKRTLSQLYIGNKISANERMHTFKALSERFPVNIYTASDTTKIPKLKNMGTAKSLTEMPVIFNRSKINLNITSKAIRTGLPLRIFDILSSGGFVLSNYQEEIPELFVPGEDMVMYGSYEEMMYLIEYYLDHDKERKAIAESGFERLKSNYTYRIQMQKMIIKAFETK